jgi:hypothetical protein
MVILSPLHQPKNKGSKYCQNTFTSRHDYLHWLRKDSTSITFDGGFANSRQGHSGIHPGDQLDERLENLRCPPRSFGDRLYYD